MVKNFNYFGDKESLLAKVVMKYEDGSREVFGTNTEDWKYFGEGPYLFSSYFAGEQYVRAGQRFTKLILCRSLMTAPGKSQLLWIPS